MKHHYHNTTGAIGSLLEEYEAKAKSQDELIIALFKNRNHPLSPSDIYVILGERIPITSIRRSISNLTRDGFLDKLQYNKVIGLYGRVECTWTLRKDSNCG
jgi:hypothetical protein